MPSRAINLVPAARRQARLVRRATRRWLALGVSYALLVFLLWATYSSTGARNYMALAAELSDVQAGEKTIKDSANALKRQLTDAVQRRAVAEEVRNRPDWSLLLSVLGKEVGDDVMLSELQVTPTDKPGHDIRAKELQIFGPDAYTISIRGVGLSQQAVSQFTLRLQRLGLFDNVQMVRSGRESLGTRAVIGFELVCPMGSAEVRK